MLKWILIETKDSKSYEPKNMKFETTDNAKNVGVGFSIRAERQPP